MIALITGAVLMNAYALALVLARSFAFRRPLYKPMVLNIGLSVVPVLIIAAALLVSGFLPFAAGRVTLVVALLVWLLALPNAGYLITELNLNHRVKGDPVPLWYDIIAVLTLAVSGVINTVLNVGLVVILGVLFLWDDMRRLDDFAVTALVAAIAVLVSLGMYLGRYLRFNSWDVKNPKRMAAKLREHFADPGALRNAMGFVLTHAFFFVLSYSVTVAPVLATAAN